MRIAVCLSGQSRTWKTAYKNILHFFNLARIHPEAHVDYFIHTWSHNTWRNKTSPQWDNWDEPALDLGDIPSVYNPVYFEVEEFSKNHMPLAWDGLLNSFMKTIHYKKMYEVNNNFRYDVVVKSRLDTIFNPNQVFDFTVTPLTAYTTHPVSKMIREFNYNNFSDVMFYADSPTMDIIGNTSRYSKKVYSQKILDNQTKWNAISAATFYGPGAILYEYMIQHSIYPTCGPVFDYAVVRSECVGMDSIQEFDKIREIGMSWYY